MKLHAKQLLGGLALTLAVALPASATQINFTGGTATLLDNSTAVTNSATTIGNVKYYEESGYRAENFGGGGYVGNYYNTGNDVLHSHWSSGDFGTVTMIKVTKLDGTAFDLNYFVLTSNTDTGGGAASGNERAFIHASSDGVNASYSFMLPVENWGLPATQIFLGSQFDNIKAFWFTVENAVDCFGMDNFFINEEAPGGNVPEPATLGLLALGLAGLGLRRRQRAR